MIPQVWIVGGLVTLGSVLTGGYYIVGIIEENALLEEQKKSALAAIEAQGKHERKVNKIVISHQKAINVLAKGQQDALWKLREVKAEACFDSPLPDAAVKQLQHVREEVAGQVLSDNP